MDNTKKSPDVVQFINGHGEFSFADDVKGNQRSLVTYIEERSNFTSKGTDYSVVAILGPQSSGKSTLLNIVFGTRFDVMDAELGRSQTTQGVWMGVAKMEGPEVLLVMDVEGTDGRERGEEDVAFERKTSLFSLAVASVLIINMWMQDIGRYQAANIGLLKTVFELNLQLFQASSSSKILLLFVIRDHVTTPLSKLSSTILKDMENIWSSLTKPPKFADSKVTDFFDFAFHTLAHKEYAAELFMTQALALRDRFTKPQNPDFLLQQQYNKGIPADGLATYAYNVWDTIKANRDLDIPSQKEMLATYRCEEIMQSALDAFDAEFKPIRDKVDRGEIVENYGAKVYRMLENASDSYNSIASRYHPEVSARKYATLRQRILTELLSVFEKLVERLRAKTLDPFFRSLVREELEGSQATLQFSSVIDSIVASAIKYFEDAVKEATLPPAAGVEWSWETQLAELKSAIAADVERLKKEHLAHLLATAKTSLENSLASPISILLESNTNSQQIWTSIRVRLEAVMAAAESELKPLLLGLSLSDEQLRRHLDTLRAYGPAIVRKCVRDAGQHLALMMQKRFEDQFNFDENKLPRRWSRRDDIPALYKSACAQAEGLVEQFALVRLGSEDDNVVICPGPEREATEIDDTDPRVVLTYKERAAVLERFRENTHASFKSAMQEQEAAKAAGTNPLLWILFIVLGWNEAVTLLSWIIGPLLLPLMMMVALGAYLIWVGKLGGPAVQIAQTMAVATGRQIWEQVQGVIDSTTGNRPAAPHPKAD